MATKEDIKSKTAEDHNTARRAAKARQKHGRKGIAEHESYFEGITAEKKAQRRAEQEVRMFANDSAQVSEARTIIDSELQPGSLAHKVAGHVLDEFPYVKREGEKTKTAVAVDHALILLSVNELTREAAVKLGLKVARNALRQAGEKIYQE